MNKLNANTQAATRKPQPAPFQVRIAPADRLVILQAAIKQGQTQSEFIRRGLVRYALEILRMDPSASGSPAEQTEP